MKRSYTQTRRAEKQAETRERIVEAVVELHEEVGPSRTTVVDIAERAGVSRQTVYTHFPDDASLVAACAAHWEADNSPPDPAEWSSVGEAVRGVYAYYRPRRQMVANIIRDAPLMPSVAAAARELFGTYADRVAAAVLPADAPLRQRAALRLALDAHTWQRLTDHEGLSDDEAADLMASLV